MKDFYLIGEIAANHNGDMTIIKRLIDACYAIGFDCVKFQKREPEVCIPFEQQFRRVDTPWGELLYVDYRKKLELNKNQFDYINWYISNKNNLSWTASVWDLPSLNFIITHYYKYIPFIKIPSAKLTDSNLLIAAAKTNKQIILSTGMSTLEEIDKAVEILKKYSKDFILLHTNSVYPSPTKDINLNVIPMLRERYNCEIGYSGHEEDLEPTIAAYVLGARYIERHITIDHNLWGTDQKASLEIQAMDILVKRLKAVSLALGDGKKIVTEGERKIKGKLRG